AIGPLRCRLSCSNDSEQRNKKRQILFSHDINPYSRHTILVQLGAPGPRVRPSGTLTLTRLPPGLPLRSGCIVSVTLSPDFSVEGFQPLRSIMPGAPDSMLH